MQEYTNFNYKIPHTVAQDASLNPLSNFVFAEIYGLLESKGQANISNQTLSNRWDKKIRTITDSLKQLKDAKFITSQQIPNHRGRLFAVHNIPTNDKFLLVPNAIKVKGYDTKLLTLNDLRIYGYLFSEYKKQSKINDDKYLNEDIIITVKNTDIVSFFNISVRTVQNSLKKLNNLNCIHLTSNQGKGLEIELNTDLIINPQAMLNSNMQKTASLSSKHANNRYPNMQKTASLSQNFMQITATQTCKRPPTNRVFNKDKLIDKKNKVMLAHRPHSKNQNNNTFSISQSDIPPEREQENIQSEINELNELDLTNSNQKLPKEEKSEVKAMNENTEITTSVVSGSRDATNDKEIDNFLDDYYNQGTSKPLPTQSSNQELKEVATFQEPIEQSSNENNTAVEPTPVAVKEAAQPVSNSSNKPLSTQRQFINQVQFAQISLANELHQKPHHTSDDYILKLMKQGYSPKEVAKMIEENN